MLIAIALVLFFSFHEILSLCNKIYVHKTKEESTVTKILTKDEFLQLKEKQEAIYAGSYDKWYRWKTQWLSNEVKQATGTILEDYYFLREHPEYDSAKIKYKVTKYKEDGKTVKYISNSKIIQVHSKNGWKNK
ncbi:hypothetical protein AN964_12065 [Heyndrickxia shackletonii]|uniref:Uncharacterized protein n=1 Tax=Heyndrickxia shackletonii TaxID=157838 RepID=A0A0Q3TJL3_9BACI|nr:hypothetical protein [Heyndrickxia shackletonii]KQL54160.1 hypothetical protein AN964_12065 [Heyndrickxia shackletonii]MBB2482467.1 hypothetical protein [Bacillus sp. APMAM]NEY99280.1 hypothetical protein [Heyndrickxia shackletonii]RTZ54134.1 hypothetical protein EKO25_19825 [Bacillus sp. SAJ1]